MGQAFDRDGNVLGEAFGDTKAEVVEKLERMHPSAHEIRVKTMGAGQDARDKVPQPEPMLQFFAFDHLPPALRDVSAPFFSLAQSLVTRLPRNPERTVALRKLLEAKDCAVRARLFQG